LGVEDSPASRELHQIDVGRSNIHFSNIIFCDSRGHMEQDEILVALRARRRHKPTAQIDMPMSPNERKPIMEMRGGGDAIQSSLF
jgi:hypothetical protein